MARARLGQVARALSGAEGQAGALPASVVKTRRAALVDEQERLTAEITTYAGLVGNVEGDIDGSGMGLVPILARAARGLSQRELADIIGVREQQIQRYESERYSGISLARYERVLRALGVDLQPKLGRQQFTDDQNYQLEGAISPALLREIREREWIDLPRNISVNETWAKFASYEEAAYPLGSSRSFHRRTLSADHSDLATKLWKSRVLQVADGARSRMKGRFNISDTGWLNQLIRLSVFPDGPSRAVERLREYGILIVIEAHLPQTMLDGAAMLLRDSIPVIALTLRHDRIDNFWFTLLHELGHVYLHFNRGLKDGFIDDVDEAGSSEVEQEADNFAQSHLISESAWKSSPVRFSKSKDLVVSFARAQGIHPAIVAGRIRRERDYTIFSDMLGRGQVRAQLMS